MRAIRHILVAASALSLGLSACGTTQDDATVRAAGERSVAVSAPARIAVTDGRTGAATTQASDSDLVRLAGGGAVRPRDAHPTPRQRDGVGAGAACPDTDLMPALGNLTRVAAAQLCLINGERADRGLAQLRLNAKLAAAALVHASDMVANSYFAHNSQDGSTMTHRIKATGYLATDARWLVGENLAWGTGSLATPRAIHNAWMNSAGHRENLLDDRYREIGIGIVLGNPIRRDGAGATYANEYGWIEGSQDSQDSQDGTAGTAGDQSGSAGAEQTSPSARSGSTRSCGRLKTRSARRACYARPCAKRSSAGKRKACRARAARMARVRR